MNDKIFNEAVNIYNSTGSIKATAKELEISEHKARKILITAGIIPEGSEIGKQIIELHESGMSADEIAKKLNLTKKYVNSYMPYEKGIYNSENTSKNAEAIRRHRNKKHPEN